MIKRLTYLLLLAWAVCPSVHHAQAQTSRSHRMIPRSTGVPLPDVGKIIPSDVLELWQGIEAELNQDGPSDFTPRMTTQPNPEEQFLPVDTADLVQRMSRNLGRSLVEALNTDISEFAEEANRRLDPQQGKSNRRVKRLPGELELKPDDVDRNLQQALELIGEHREAFQKVVEQYQRTWPQDRIAPRAWLQKVQPYINQQMLTQLREAAKDLQAQQKLPKRSNAGPRPSERNAAADTTAKESRNNEPHSNPVVGSVLKAFDTRSTELLKSAAAGSNKRRGSWWKRWQQETRDKLKSWNQQLTENSREIVHQRRYAAPGAATPWKLQQSSPWTQAGYLWLLVPSAFVIAGLVYWLSKRIPRNARRMRPPPPEPQTITDAPSFLAALHDVSGYRFGVRSQFWDHRQLVGQLGRASGLAPESVGQLSKWYQRARYADEGPPWNADEIRSIQKLFAVVRKHCWATP